MLFSFVTRRLILDAGAKAPLCGQAHGEVRHHQVLQSHTGAIEEGNFREDLFYRVSGVRLLMLCLYGCQQIKNHWWFPTKLCNTRRATSSIAAPAHLGLYRLDAADVDRSSTTTL